MLTCLLAGPGFCFFCMQMTNCFNCSKKYKIGNAKCYGLKNKFMVYYLTILDRTILARAGTDAKSQAQNRACTKDRKD
jgi:hypothetical protein